MTERTFRSWEQVKDQRPSSPEHARELRAELEAEVRAYQETLDNGRRADSDS